MQVNKLQIGLIAGAVILTFIVVLVLIGVLPGLRGESGAGGAITIWGFEPETAMQEFFGDFKQDNDTGAKYIRKNIASWEADLLNTLARGGIDAPDVLIFPSDYLKRHKDKLAAAPAALITEREIRQQFIEAADAFLGSKNEIFGMPFYMDALVLYWNKDLFTQNLITLPPKTWDDFRISSERMTKKDSGGSIVISGAALGRGLNIKNMPLILTTMFLQAGDRIISSAGEIVLGESGSAGIRPTESVLRFASDFSNPRKTMQSWTPALPEARDAFTSGKLAMYLGRVSEYNEIKNKNPHLNIAAALLPQLQNAPRPVTGGTLYALSVTRASRNQLAAWQFAKFMTNRENSAAYADKTGGVSLRRDVLPNYQKESVRSVFAESALALKLWPVLEPKSAEQIFRDLMEDVALERATIREAIDKAKARLQQN